MSEVDEPARPRKLFALDQNFPDPIVEVLAGFQVAAELVPLRDIDERLAEIDPQAQPVFICRSGGRSMTACQLAVRANIRAPANLEGGMLAWASSIDPSIRVV